MNRIRILSEKVASQIAAGEVIERPFSVVRELMDNSIDAEAKRIAVQIQRGGKWSIKVSDNGHGMGRDDLLLSVERHATSKIRDIEDLFAIRTLGFRGEALPSIGSVSKMEIISRTQDSLVAHKLVMNGGKIDSLEEIGAPPGTTVKVKDLFFNVPARKKFLRTDRTETDRIIDIFTRLSLSFPEIHFSLETDGTLLLNLSPTKDLKQRLAVILGKEVAKVMISTKEERMGISLEAYLAPPDLGRSKGDRIFAYVNGRNIKDRLVNKAILEGYGQRLMKGIFPQVVLFLQLDPSLVDVNVHPTKQEVRFRNSQDVYRAISMTINKALDISKPFPIARHKEEEIRVFEPDTLAWGNEIRETGKTSPDLQKEPETGIQGTLFDQGINVLGQLGKMYILCQVSDGLMIVDQHAAHERIVYEKLKQDFESLKIETQNLLIPKRIEFGLKERRILEKQGHLLKEFGIELEHFGGNTFLLRAVPVILLQADWDQLLSELVASLGERRIGDHDNIDRLITLMACHGAIRAGHSLNFEEMNHLLIQLQKLSIPTNCPHGRPIFLHFTYEEFEKMFKRVV